MTSTAEMVGQMLMVGLDGTELSGAEKRFLEDCPAGGFILFDGSLEEPAQILSLCRSLRDLNKEIPPLIAIDHEGGRVHRLPPPFTRFPPARSLGRSGDPQLAREVGRAMARELSAVGINLNFAPVLDVHSNPQNPVIGDRALGTDPDTVIRFAGPLIDGLREEDVIPCGKHFPGHGDTAEDSHLELPVVGKNSDSLCAVELPPFRFACRMRIESLMTAHVLYPALDPDRPATLSRPIIGSLLRRGLAYRGVVFADDLQMRAISKRHSPEEAALLGVEAGIDVLLFCRGRDDAARAFERLRFEAEKSEAIRARVEESANRIRRLKERRVRSLRGDGAERLKDRVGLAAHRRLAERI